MDLGRESTGVYGKPVWNALEGKWVGTFRIRNPCSFPKAKLYPARVATGTARPDPSRPAVEAGGGARHRSDFEGIGGCADPVGLRHQRPAGLARAAAPGPLGER